MDHKDLAGYSIDRSGRSQVEKNEFEDIFREMLHIENTKNLGSKVKYCLVKISIKNYGELTFSMKADEKNSMLFRFSSFLFKNLRKKDIYLMSEPGKFLVIFPDISIDAADTALKRVAILAEKEFGNSINVSWEVLIGSNREEEIKPFLKKADIISETGPRAILSRGAEKVVMKKQAANIIFRNFILSFLLFSVILVAGVIIIFYGSSRFEFFPGYNSFSNFLANMMPGLINYFSSLDIKAAPLLFFIILMLLLSLVFGTGMFAGFIINMKMKNSGIIKYRIAAIQNKSSQAV
jgi:hypothetical protein